MCLDINGIIFTFGSNEYGQLGIGKDKSALHFTHEIQQVCIPPVAQICCGGLSSYCVSEVGDLYSFGCNTWGQLGDEGISYTSPQRLESVKDIEFVESGYSHVFCKTLQGSVYCWGDGRYGQLGTGLTRIQHFPLKCENWPDDIVDIKCGSSHTLVLTFS